MSSSKAVLLAGAVVMAAAVSACQGSEECTPDCGTCTPACTPECAGKACGDDDGCGGQCAGCPGGQTCNEATWTCQACLGVPPNATENCDTCRAAACCPEAQACVAEPSCRAWLECEDACAADDTPCQSNCWRTLAAGREKSSYMACKQRACAGTCSAAECSEDYNSFDAPDDACRACENLHCCNEIAACWHDAECVDAIECFSTCADHDCMVSLCNDAEHTAYLTKVAPQWACRSRYCVAECETVDSCSAVFVYEPPCSTCLHDSCCAENRACSEDVECIEYMICRAQCGANDHACRDDCRARHWKGGGRDSVRVNCMNSRCQTECGLAARGCGRLEHDSTTCLSCNDLHCCTEAEACGTNADCAGVFLCMTACHGDAACEATCRLLGVPSGVALYDQLATCRAASCASECPEG
jgi:hypothetical protein